MTSELRKYDLSVDAEILPVPTEPSKDFVDQRCKGLSLRITNTCARVWYFTTKIDGRKLRTRIGQFDRKHFNYAAAVNAAVRLRAEADKARAGLARNPLEIREQEREAKKAENATKERKATGADAFATMCDRYLKEWATHIKTEKTKRSVDQEERNIEAFWKPAFEGKDASEITNADVRKVLDKLTNGGQKFVARNRRLSLLRTIFNRANEHGFFGEGVTILNPCLGISKKHEAPRQVALRPDEIKAVWHGLERRSEEFKNMARLNLLTAAREGEIRIMKWEDLDIDSDEPTWTIAAESTKTGHVYINPLSKQAVALLYELRERAGKPVAGYVFPSGKNDGQPISENIGRQVRLLRNDTKLKFQFRDLRRTAATVMTSSCGVSHHTMDRCLNHIEQGIGATYNAHDYQREKREAFDKLGQRIEIIVSGGALRIAPLKPEIATAPEKLTA